MSGARAVVGVPADDIFEMSEFLYDGNLYRENPSGRFQMSSRKLGHCVLI